MAITPQERKHLKSGHFKPLTTNGKSITLYQFTTNTCPFLKDNKCVVYVKRPVACRMYPLNPTGVSHCRNPEGQDVWPTETYEAVKLFSSVILPFLKDARWRFNLVVNKWEKCRVNL
jgi:Fe-S-cluster containining protein